MSSRRHVRGKTKGSRGVPTQWSEWEWHAAEERYRRYRLDAYGEYEFDYKYQHNDSEVTNVAAQSSTIYPSSSVAVTQSSIEDLNAQYQGLDVGTSRERGRKSREDLHLERHREGQPRDPSISPVRPVKPGPKPPPFPQPPKSSSAYEPFEVYNAPEAASQTPADSTPYPHIPTVQHGSDHDGEYNDGLHEVHEPSSLQYYNQDSLPIRIKKTPLVSTISSSKDSFISSATVDQLKLGRKKLRRPWTYTHPESGKDYDIRESVTTNIDPDGRERLKDVQLYVLTRKCPLKNPVVLGTDILGTVQDYYLSSDYEYEMASSRRPSFNQPAAAHPPPAYTHGQASYSSPLSVYHQPIVAQSLPSVKETPSSSYPTSSYPMQAGRTMSDEKPTSYYPPLEEPHRSRHESYAAHTSTHDRYEDSAFSSYDSGTYSGAKGGSGAGEGGMEYDVLYGDDNYSLHSDSHATHPAYNTPQPIMGTNEPQNVYLPTSGDRNDYITRH